MGDSATTTRPPAPEELTGESLLEWDRVCGELAEAGRLKSADRAMIVLWCQTWAIYQAVTRHVNQFGAILPAANKVIGKSPWYTVQRECHNALVKMATEMGLTCASRNYDHDNQDEPTEL
jgi:P27 family predicted phage terminase small subunit